MNQIKLILLLVLLPSTQLFSQNNKIQKTSSCESIIDLYNNEIHNSHEYIHGREYKIYHHPNYTKPYLNSAQGNGTIFSNGHSYNVEILIYDIFKDEIVTTKLLKDFSFVNIQLKKARIDSFKIKFENEKYHFVQIKNKLISELPNGFYEIPYSGDTQLLLKYISSRNDINGIIEFKHSVNRILKINKNYFDINTKKKFLSLFSNHKKIIIKKLRSFNYSYRNLPKKQLVELIKYAESI